MHEHKLKKHRLLSQLEKLPPYGRFFFAEIHLKKFAEIYLEILGKSVWKILRISSLKILRVCIFSCPLEPTAHCVFLGPKYIMEEKSLSLVAYHFDASPGPNDKKS